MGKIVIRVFVIRYSGIIVCAAGDVCPLFDVIPQPVILSSASAGRRIPSKAATPLLKGKGRGWVPKELRNERLY